MKRKRSRELDFEVDNLTNSIQNTLSGDSFDTEISLLTNSELKLLKNVDWVFDWKAELKDITKQVYKLTVEENTTIIQGLISMEDRRDHIFMHLIESAKFN